VDGTQEGQLVRVEGEVARAPAERPTLRKTGPSTGCTGVVHISNKLP